MSFRYRGLILAAVLFVFAGPALAIKIRTDYDHKVDFSRYKTYSWIKVETADPLWVDRIKDAIGSGLTAKGWKEVPAGGDVSISAVGTTRTKHSLETFYDHNPGWRWGGFGGGTATTTVENCRVGTLVVDMFDSGTKKLIWRGSASDVLSDKPAKNEQKLKKSVGKMFKHFPPQPAKQSASTEPLTNPAAQPGSSTPQRSLQASSSRSCNSGLRVAGLG